MPTRADMAAEMEKLDLTDRAPRDHDEYLRQMRQPGPQGIREPGLGDQLHQAYDAVRSYVKRKTGY